MSCAATGIGKVIYACRARQYVLSAKCLVNYKFGQFQGCRSLYIYEAFRLTMRGIRINDGEASHPLTNTPCFAPP